MKLTFPELSLLVLVGPSGAGKSTFARKHFLPTEVVSADACRALVCDDENSAEVNREAFAVFHEIICQRLKLGRFTVADATNVDPQRRRELAALARQYHMLPSALVFDIPAQVCQERNRSRDGRDLAPHVIKRHIAQMKRGLRGLKKEGFRAIRTFQSVEQADAVDNIEREPLWNNRGTETGPFDIVGDVHGCHEELMELIAKLGYEIDADSLLARHPDGRRLIFAGDLVDRGPDSPAVLRFVMANVAADKALCVPGNHDIKLLRHLSGRKIALTHGLDETVRQIKEDPIDRRSLRDFLDGLVSHYVFDGGRLVVAHAGLKEAMQGRGSGAVREFCLYGDTTGERDEFGLPERLDWAAGYRGKALVVYGHTPFAQPRWLNNTVNIDTGCVYGGRLTALRYPERETVSVPAKAAYAETARPLHDKTGGPTAQQIHDQILDLADITGKTFVDTRYRTNLSLRPENAMAALEIMSRFAVDPRWLIYLPPTMSPCSASQRDGWLERPEEAFAYYRKSGIGTVICQEKHMGSRTVIVVCRDTELAVRRFGMEQPSRGVIYTRTGRPFFAQPEFGDAILERLAAALEVSGLWQDLATGWLCLDCELMPWSVKAQELLETQYAAAAAAGTAYHSAGVRLAESAVAGRGDSLDEVSRQRLTDLRNDLRHGGQDIESYRRAYGRYCWPVGSIGEIRLAPFHFLAGEGCVYCRRDHLWHMELAEKLSTADPELIQTTRWRATDLESEQDIAEAASWWEDLTGKGGEGMVVKPRDFVARDHRGRIIQPAVKCRGREYLRLIYGPAYTQPENLKRLRNRALGHKRSMAEREFFLGLEALERFVEKRPLREIHECVFALLALESEPVDPRL